MASSNLNDGPTVALDPTPMQPVPVPVLIVGAGPVGPASGRESLWYMPSR